MQHLVIESPLGPVLIAGQDGAVTGLWFEDQRYAPTPERLGPRVLPGEDPLLDEAARQLTDYLAGKRQEFDLPLAPVGTPRQRAVWDALLRIPHGEVTTYGALAREVGSPRAAQSVGQAVGHNPISIVIPCHRVLGANGSMTGYAGGLERKRALLTLEGYRGPVRQEQALF